MRLFDLPDEILEKIFLQISTHDVQQNLAKVCKRFLKVSRLPTMVKNYSRTIKSFQDDEVAACLEEVKTVTRLFPAAKLELIYVDRSKDPFYPQPLSGSLHRRRDFFRLENLRAFIPFVRKLHTTIMPVDHSIVLRDLAKDMPSNLPKDTFFS